MLFALVDSSGLKYDSPSALRVIGLFVCKCTSSKKTFQSRHEQQPLNCENLSAVPTNGHIALREDALFGPFGPSSAM